MYVQNLDVRGVVSGGFAQTLWVLHNCRAKRGAVLRSKRRNEGVKRLNGDRALAGCGRRIANEICAQKGEI